MRCKIYLTFSLDNENVTKPFKMIGLLGYFCFYLYPNFGGQTKIWKKNGNVDDKSLYFNLYFDSENVYSAYRILRPPFIRWKQNKTELMVYWAQPTPKYSIVQRSTLPYRYNQCWSRHYWFDCVFLMLCRFFFSSSTPVKYSTIK